MKKVFKFLAILIILLVAKLLYNEYKLNQTSHFTITSDTNVSAIPGLSKYVTQEEVDEFAFDYWDIHTYKVDNNETLESLRHMLQEKDTSSVIGFFKKYNLSVDAPLHYGVTPLMYSSFYDDVNTTKELIKLGANIHQKDKYKLSPLAYAIENNSIKTAEILLKNGVDPNSVKYIQKYLDSPAYASNLIDYIVVDGENIEIKYNVKIAERSEDSYRPSWTVFFYLGYSNFVEMADLLLKNGYRADYCKHSGDKVPILDICYDGLENIPNYEPMLELMLKYNVPGQPTKEQLKEAYDECYEDRAWFLNGDYDDYIYNATRLNKIMEKEGMKIKQPISKIEYDSNKARTLRYYNKHCTDKNGTFKDTKAYIDYANESAKEYAVSRFLRINKNNPSKVIYLDKHSSKSNSNLTDKNKNKN
ncbi:ankyrin repeat domain-containing protein [Campylobacter geochelonis]|uniref:ankyrin repeat domain-containing protein n=2 Tax=Campylobacter geochelonis TaxID=1780362 RepID=UPI00155D9161|nr:ankyrin repeat domain-containing protein [Campylobacter geochelonis]QKF71498.1 ankyrin domain-containing protein [Campylobacter geochelonis]